MKLFSTKTDILTVFESLSISAISLFDVPPSPQYSLATSHNAPIDQQPQQRTHCYHRRISNDATNGRPRHYEEQ